MRAFLLITILTLNAFSNAHTAAIRALADQIDVFVPGPRTAWADDAWSLFINPAGLAFVDGTQLVGGYNYRVQAGQDGVHQGQGSLGLSLFEGINLALGLELALPQNQANPEKGVIGASFGAAFRLARLISFGGRVVKQRRYANTYSDPFWFTLGVEAFPFSWMSLGINSNQVFDNVWSKPEVRAGIAFRPFGEKFTVSAESRFWPLSPGLNTDFSIHPEIGARLDLGGFTFLASARVEDVAKGLSTPTLFAGVEVNFDHFGIAVVADGRPVNLLNAGGRFRLSSEIWPALAQNRPDFSLAFTNVPALPKESQ